jgi:hypothetical protein
VEDPAQIAPNQDPARYANIFGYLLRVGFGNPSFSLARYAVVNALGIKYGEEIPTSHSMLFGTGPYAASGDSGGPTFWYPPAQSGKAGLIAVQTSEDGLLLTQSTLGMGSQTKGNIHFTGSYSGATRFSQSDLQKIQNIVSQNSSDAIVTYTATAFFGGTPSLAPGKIPNKSLKFAVSSSVSPVLQWTGVSDYPPSSYLVYIQDLTSNTFAKSAYVTHIGGGVTHTYTATGLTSGHNYLDCVIPAGSGYPALGANEYWVTTDFSATGSTYNFTDHCSEFLLSAPANKVSDLQVSIVKIAYSAMPNGYYYAGQATWSAPPAASGGAYSIQGYRAYDTRNGSAEVTTDSLVPTTARTSGYIEPGATYCVAVAAITSPANLGPKSDFKCAVAPAQ